MSNISIALSKKILGGDKMEYSSELLGVTSNK